MIINSPFKAAWWLSSPHLQTVYASLFRRKTPPITQTQRLELPDGDFIDLAWATANLNNNSPLVVILHGLGGGVSSTYVAGLMSAFNARGWRAVLLQFRGAGDEPNRLHRAYHSGDTADFNYLLHYLAEAQPGIKMAAVGISLGGNVLLKWLGEQGEQTLLCAATAISVPFQLNLIADRMGRGFSRVYQRYLLGRLKMLFQRKKQFHSKNPHPAYEDLTLWNCFWTFDDHVTAPLHGFNNVHDYYRESSSRAYIKNIKTPTLIIHALDDPFMTKEVIPDPDQIPEQVTLELSTKGGHVGFISGTIPFKPIFWLDERVPDFLQAYLE